LDASLTNIGINDTENTQESYCSFIHNTINACDKPIVTCGLGFSGLRRTIIGYITQIKDVFSDFKIKGKPHGEKCMHLFQELSQDPCLRKKLNDL
jgi:hypothetical protein